MVNPVSTRLLSQQLIAPQWKDPADVVSWFGAMQGRCLRRNSFEIAAKGSTFAV